MKNHTKRMDYIRVGKRYRTAPADPVDGPWWSEGNTNQPPPDTIVRVVARDFGPREHGAGFCIVRWGQNRRAGWVAECALLDL